MTTDSQHLEHSGHTTGPEELPGVIMLISFMLFLGVVVLLST